MSKAIADNFCGLQLSKKGVNWYQVYGLQVYTFLKKVYTTFSGGVNRLKTLKIINL